MPTTTWWSTLLRWLGRLKLFARTRADLKHEPPSGPAPDGAGPPRRSYGLPTGLELIEDKLWRDQHGVLDPGLRLAISLIERQDSIQLLERTGIDLVSEEAGAAYLPLHIELNVDPGTAREFLDRNGLKVPQLYYDEAKRNDKLRNVTARLRLKKIGIVHGEVTDLRNKLLELGAGAHSDTNLPAIIKRISLANPLQPCFAGPALGDIDLPKDRQFGGTTLDGADVVVGIIDDGCAFAHRDFLRPGTSSSRVVYLWDQARNPATAANGWVASADLPYGCEITNNPADARQYIDEAIGHHIGPGALIREDEVYRELGYVHPRVLPALASHGTHVMGIAAGNGTSTMGFEGVAPAADIVFVQFPTAAIEMGMAALSLLINDAVAYVFARAAKLGKPAVVNISYGGYAGPHDGTSPVEAGIDDLLALPDRAVVVSAGNGFEADCHAHDTVKPGHSSTPLHWVVHPFDPTLNFMQIWYNGTAKLELSLTSPGGEVLGPVKLGAHLNIVVAGSADVVGLIDHQTNVSNNDNRIEITLNPTMDDPTIATAVPAPSGIWTVQLKNVGTAHEANVHAWIERDDAGHPGSARRRQSEFVTADADPEFTLASLATGLHTIAVGAYNTATQEVCRYSACGPTRPTGGHRPRRKPEVCAPAEEEPLGRGVLSASSRKARATRMNGTSASSPHVAGLVALMLQYRCHVQGAHLTTDEIRDTLRGAARQPPLRENRHQIADPTRDLKRQANVPWHDVIGAGKIDALGTLQLF